MVDDGSTDDTREVAQEANKGYGAALRSCFEYAKANEVDSMVILDGDGQHDPSSIPLFVFERTDRKWHGYCHRLTVSGEG